MKFRHLLHIAAVFAAGFFTLDASSQTPRLVPGRAHGNLFDVAVTFQAEHVQMSQAGSPSVWLKGASLDGSYRFYRGLGVALNISGGTNEDIGNNVRLSKFAYMAGPRYTISAPPLHCGKFLQVRRPVHVFGEALFGGVHGFDASFPYASFLAPSANGFSMQVGGGADVALRKGFGIRLFEADWVHTALSNNASNTQNDARLAVGISYRY